MSRIDQLVDPLLEMCIAQGGKLAQSARNARGQVAIARAKGAYQIFKGIFGSQRFKSLVKKNARVQRPRWARTGTTTPNYDDIKYVEALIGADTVNTLLLLTRAAYRDHGDPKARLEVGVEEAGLLLARLPQMGIHIEKVAQHLEDEGIGEITQSFDKLLAAMLKTG